MSESETATRIGRGSGGREQVRLLVDGHVHVHPAHDEAALVASSYQKLRGFGAGLPTLFLTECAGVSVFEKWRDGSARVDVRRTGEGESIVVNDRLLVLAGRQVVTRERIEVLALATNSRIKDGMTLEETLDEVGQAGAVAVLPWGLGKWLGARGKRVEEVAAKRRLLLGDNAGRPGFWPEPGIFKKHPVLPGTDPLKAAGEELLAGGYGFRLDCELELDRPAESIRRALFELTPGGPPRLGKRISFPDSIMRQFAHLMPGASPHGSRQGRPAQPSAVAAESASDAPRA
jgi:hypothetical protein